MMRVGLPSLLLVMLLLVSLAACGSDRVAQSTATRSPPTESTSTQPTSTRSSTPPDVAGADAESGPLDAAAEPAEPESVAGTDALDQDCRPLADLEDADELMRWRVVNDGVMGGRSSGEASVDESVLLVAGEIVTDGGGFSSVRLALDEPLGEVTSLLLRVRTDGRSYELTVADAVPDRDRRVSYQAPIAAVGDGEWEEVVVDFDDLDASIFGRPVDVDPFDPGAAVEVGVILADGGDGPFRFELDWIRTCQ